MPSPARPRNVFAVFILLLLTGVLGLIGGIGAIVGGASAAVSGADDALGYGFIIAGVAALVSAILNIVLAFGVRRGSNAARIVASVIQVASLALGIYALVATGKFDYSILHGVIFPAVILVMLWTGEPTRRFFARG